MLTKSLWVLAIVLTASVVACTLDNPEAPDVSGPSELGRSIEVRANPDQIVSDGWSNSIIEAVLRGPNSERIPGATIHFDIRGFVDRGNLAPVNGPRPTYGGVEAGPVAATTDGDGVARARYWAPFRTDEPSDNTVTIIAREASTNFRQGLQTVGEAEIFLRAADRPFPGLPAPAPGCDAPSADFDLSGLCTGGEILSGRTILVSGAASEAGEAGAVVTTYIWNWGDGNSDQTGSSSASHVYSPSLNGFAVTVTLTVVNSCGASAATSETGLEIVPACP